MGNWMYGTGSIVFERQVENDYFLIEEIISRYVPEKFFYNNTLSYIREVSDLQPFEDKYSVKRKNNKRYSKEELGFKRNATEEIPLKIKAIHFMYANEDCSCTKEEYLNMIKGLHSIFSIRQATFIFESDYGKTEVINLSRNELSEFDSENDYKNK